MAGVQLLRLSTWLSVLLQVPQSLRMLQQQTQASTSGRSKVRNKCADETETCVDVRANKCVRQQWWNQPDPRGPDSMTMLKKMSQMTEIFDP